MRSSLERCRLSPSDVISLIIGILSLVFYSDYEVRAYFDKITLG